MRVLSALATLSLAATALSAQAPATPPQPPANFPKVGDMAPDFTAPVAGKDGVGIYVDAKPGVEAVRMEIQSPETGWRAEIFGATGSRVPESIESGWQPLGGGEVRSDHQRFKLADSGERYRYYLVWITQLPPDSQRVEIGEIALLQRTATRR